MARSLQADRSRKYYQPLLGFEKRVVTRSDDGCTFPTWTIYDCYVLLNFSDEED